MPVSRGLRGSCGRSLGAIAIAVVALFAWVATSGALETTSVHHEGAFDDLPRSRVEFDLRSTDSVPVALDDFQFQRRWRCTENYVDRRGGGSVLEIPVRDDLSFYYYARRTQAETGGMGSIVLMVRGQVRPSGQAVRGELRYKVRYNNFPGEPVCRTGLRGWRTSATSVDSRN